MQKKSYIIFLLLIIIVIFFDSFLKTGCIHYAFINSCLPTSNINWSVDKSLLEHNSDTIILWAKGFYHQGIERVEDAKIYLQNFNWVLNWSYVHFYNKILDSILIILLILSILYLFFKNNKKKDIQDKKIIFFLFLSLVFWFLTLPQFRFGFSIIILIIFFILRIFLRKNIYLKKKQYVFVIILSVTYFNYINLERIYKEFLRNDEFKFLNFPFFPTIEKNYIYKFTDQNKKYYSPPNNLHQDHCFNLPTICSAKNIDILDYDFAYKKIIFIKKLK